MGIDKQEQSTDELVKDAESLLHEVSREVRKQKFDAKQLIKFIIWKSVGE